MFDRYSIEAPPVSVNVRVDEHRAPTDDSVKLLHEMEKAAEKKVIQSLRLDDNSFKCVITKIHSMITDEYRYRVNYELNGRASEVNVILSTKAGLESLAKRLVDEVAQDVAHQMLMQAFKDVKL